MNRLWDTRGQLIFVAVAALLLAACGNDEPGSNAGCTEQACSGHGSCSDASGAPVCSCEAGYQGSSCAECATGYHLEAGACVADGAKCQPESCNGHGSCDDTSGAPVCRCETAYQGSSCAECAAGYHLEAGACVADGAECQPESCTGHGSCDDSSGAPVCSCEAGYQGSSCGECATGYHLEAGACVADGAECQPESCNGHGSCDDTSGAPVCSCEAAYQGASCGECATGYQDNALPGTCVPGCALTTIDCGAHGECDDANGTPHCACDTGYQGTNCGSCASGFQDENLDGTCLADCTTANLSCGAHGDCSTQGGTAHCACDMGYQGTNCGSCASGFQDENLDGTCLADCTTANLSCGAHGDCSTQGGTAHCACDAGYQGAACADCAPGFVPDGAGGCTVASTGDGTTCESAIDLQLVSGTISGNTTGSGDDYTPSCRSTDSEDLVYRFTVTDPVEVSFETSGFDTVLFLRGECAGADLVCNDDVSFPANPGSYLEASLAAGTYHLIVDGYDGAAGAFELTVQVTSNCLPGELPDGQGGCVDDPCAPNPCSAANTHCEPALPGYDCACDPGYLPGVGGACVLDPNPKGEGCTDAIVLSGEGSVTGTTSDARDDGTGSCVPDAASRPDRVYAFTAGARTRYQFMMTGFDSVLHLRRVCADSATELACNDDSQGTAAALNGFVDQGTYFLFADGYPQTGASYTLDFSLRTDPCAADVCPGTPECVADADWAAYQCVCPAGTVAHDGNCVDDPCAPNPCTAPNQGRCTAQLPGAYTCGCNPGFIDDGSGGCMTDPNANQWTVMVFLNGDNNLDSYGDTDLQEMATAGGSNDYVNIIVLHDSSGSGDSRIVRVTAGGYEVLEELGEVDMGSAQTLSAFGVWTVQNFPARRYALVMWDHGDGWKAPPAPLQALKGFSNDDHGSYAGISISDGSYASALSAISTAAGGKLELVGFDACLMGMYEVAKATAPYARYFVGSEETEPGNGWAYHAFLPSLLEDHTIDGLALGRAIVDAYHADAADNATLSVVDLTTIPALDTALSSFADALRASPALYPSLDTARGYTQAFYTSYHRDLRDFSTRVAAMSNATAAMRSTAAALQLQLQSTVAYYRSQSDYPGAHGLAIYLPGTSDVFDSDYRGAGATWSTATTWDDFVQDFAR